MKAVILFFFLQKGEYEVPEWLSPGNLFHSEMSVGCDVMFLLLNNSGVQLKYSVLFQMIHPPIPFSFFVNKQDPTLIFLNLFVLHR